MPTASNLYLFLLCTSTRSRFKSSLGEPLATAAEGTLATFHPVGDPDDRSTRGGPDFTFQSF